MVDKEKALELSTRKDIFSYISEYPGCYLRQIKDALDLAMGQVSYHLGYLEDHGLISHQMSGNKKRYFINDEVNYPDRKIIGLLRQKIPRTILIFMLENGSCTFSQLLENFDVSKSTLSFHLKKLRKASLLSVGKEGKNNVYTCKDGRKVAQVLITYRESFIDDAVERFVNTWTGLRT